jgi:lipid-binding SYLF domain-containing protein
MGLGYSVGMGTGLVVARRESDDSWSPPSAIAGLSAGWGIQVRHTCVAVSLRRLGVVQGFANVSNTASCTPQLAVPP